MEVLKQRIIVVTVSFFVFSVIVTVYHVSDDGPMTIISEQRQDAGTMTKQIQDFQSRIDRVSRACKRCGGACSFKGIEKAPRRQLRWLVKRNMVMCFTPKVGTSTWLEYMMTDAFPGRLAEARHQHSMAQALLRSPKLHNKTENLHLLQQFGKVLPVRHPFVRLVSAYLDKIVNCPIRVCYHIKKGSGRKDELPSFEDFVRFLIETIPVSPKAILAKASAINVHWRPFYLLCSPCDIQYDYVITMETWDQDTRFILEKFSIPGNGLLHRHMKNSSTRALEYFKELPQSLVTALYKRYKIDFDMFGYTPDEYMSKNEDE